MGRMAWRFRAPESGSLLRRAHAQGAALHDFLEKVAGVRTGTFGDLFGGADGYEFAAAIADDPQGRYLPRDE